MVSHWLPAIDASDYLSKNTTKKPASKQAYLVMGEIGEKRVGG